MLLICSSFIVTGGRITLLKQAVCWHQATNFGRAAAPWRETIDEVRRDLIELGLGSFEDAGRFYITVPGGIRRQWGIVEIDDVA